jgi:hypothetical protein
VIPCGSIYRWHEKRVSAKRPIIESERGESTGPFSLSSGRSAAEVSPHSAQPWKGRCAVIITVDKVHAGEWSGALMIVVSVSMVRVHHRMIHVVLFLRE